MNNKYVGRIDLHESMFRNRTVLDTYQLIKRQMADSFRRCVEDKINPLELIDDYTRNYNTRIYEQTLYIFTKEELQDFIKTNLVITIKDVDKIL